ncbi:hypothetical protein CC86DRAFT_463919 [Ophiobolus disseminans]|uniref:Nuclear fusion protein KAR5 n=1 Tax=Ophiobolus disseminans TaxID=1469910 RepID=A0A6A7AD81_9PLEO|nr:hypothetical protein CC86DRAFT_463919 [Ophiobolus disseminans]
MKPMPNATKSAVLAVLLSSIPATVSHYHSPPADAAPTVNVDALFQHTTSRNHRVITQAVDFVVSMQNAPTCTRLAASNLMNECKLLENAPDFAKSRPEAYLDNIKTEYAAKLAVCELLSAQPSNPTPPANCDILVPTSRACGKGSTWWYSRPEATMNDKQCYPEFKEYQYVQCLKSLQSSPQYWTSFSNARQNAVVMCQASRDAIERENHLETFKNLTQVMGVVSSAMKKATEEYEALVKDQKQFADEVREAQAKFKEEAHAVQENALATVGTLDNKFHTFMETSISELITALADNQSNEIGRIRQEMQAFSGDLMAESSQFARFFNDQLQAHHEQALTSLQVNHEAQIDSYNILSSRMGDIHNTANKTNKAANSSFHTIMGIEQQLVNLSNQADHIAQGFAFFSAIPHLLSSLVRGFVATVGIIFLFTVLCKVNRRFATYAAGACSSAYLFHLCGLYQWLGNLPTHAANVQEQTLFSIAANLSSTQKAAGLMMLLWLGAYPVGFINVYLGSIIGSAISKLLGSYWLRQYTNDGGMGLLPSIEIPPTIPSHKVAPHDGFVDMHSLAYPADTTMPIYA